MSGYVVPERGGRTPEHDASGQALDAALPVLGLYYRALAARRTAIVPAADERDARSFQDTEATIGLPARIDRFAVPQHNFAWYKIALTHRAAHYEGGTFSFSFAREATQFAQRLRPAPNVVERETHASDLDAFLHLFARRELALEVFTHCEDLRLDEWLKRRYPGLASAFTRVQRAAIEDRPPVAHDRPRDALREVLARFTLDLGDAPAVPRVLHDSVRQLREALAPLARPDATVEDSAEAAMRAYTLIVRAPDAWGDYGAPVVVDLAQPAMPLAWSKAWPESDTGDGDDIDVVTGFIAPIGYRDRLGARCGLREGAQPANAHAMYRSSEVRAGTATAMTPTGAPGDTAPSSTRPAHADDARRATDDVKPRGPGELDAADPSTFVYPEWDHLRGAYRRNWCLLRESRVEPAASARYFDETLAAYGMLVPEIRRQIERLEREGLRRVQRTSQGDEVDLDAAIEAIVDRRAGLSPSPNVYVARRRLARDLCAAFLLDMSFSTAEHVPDGPDERAEAHRLRGRMVHGRRYRTILDLEKESMALLMSALERVGDAYGVYGFSGSGRSDVRFYVLKDFDEALTQRVASRLCSVEPVHTTRMGPAIRHATRKLRAHGARTRLLVLISDGRPFDLEYGQQYGDGAEVEYAIRDTREALNEARALGVTPFVLTVDPRGHDYLRAMCDGLDYEVLDDVRDLPARLISLYRGITAD